MIEAVARAIWDCSHEGEGAVDYGWEDDLSEQAACRDLARAALLALREPSQEMVEAMAAGMFAAGPGWAWSGVPADAKERWRRMAENGIRQFIDAALHQPGEGDHD